MYPQPTDDVCGVVLRPVDDAGKSHQDTLHTPSAVTYHEQPDYCRFMIGHSLGRMGQVPMAVVW